MNSFADLIATPDLSRPSEILCGPGSIEQTSMVLKKLGCSAPLIVADPIMRELGLIERLRTSLKKSEITPIGVFADIVPEPDEASIKPIARKLKRARADSVVSLGGGSAIDSAKAACLMAQSKEPLRNLKAPFVNNERLLPHVALPTTAGTGSEVTLFTVVTDNQSGEKMLLAGPGLMPDAAIVDADLSVTQPPRLTADTGLDALTHAIEAFVSKKSSVHIEPLALSAMSKISSALREAYSDGSNQRARDEMMQAATLAGLAFSNSSVALVHGMSRPLGAHFHVPHGLSNAILLPLITAYSLSGAPSRYAICARACGFAATSDDEATACTKLVKGLEALNIELGVPSLAGWGIDRESFYQKIDRMCFEAIASGSPRNNPTHAPIGTMARLYAMAYEERPALEATHI